LGFGNIAKVENLEEEEKRIKVSDLDQLGLLTHKSIINIPKLFSFLIINYL
jgi:hypothetical protein